MEPRYLVYSRGTNVERFWRYVDRGEDCWTWRGRLNETGYGQFSWRRSDGTYQKMVASRACLMLVLGRALQRFEFACHRCDNPACVRPAHLFLGTPKDNAHDCIAKGRAKLGAFYRAKTHCKHGHEFTPTNTYWEDGRHRKCKVCRREKGRRWDERQREKRRA